MICNTGIGLIPTVDGQVEWFSEKGLYDGLFLMSDERTGTYWNHMTGEAVQGPLTGNRLELENVLHTTVAQALAQDPETQLAWSSHPRAVGRSEGGGGTLTALLRRIRGLPEIFSATLGAEDERRPRMDMGIGIWNDTNARYYSMDAIEENGRLLLDTFEGQRVLIYYDPTAYALAAQYTDADRAWWDGDVLRFSTGEFIEDGVRYADDGSRVERERPLQVFTRWYGFSLTFPETEVYGEG